MTYKEIQESYRNDYGTTIKTCWIADVKRELGLTTRRAYNRVNRRTVLYPCPSNEIRERIIQYL